MGNSEIAKKWWTALPDVVKNNWDNLKRAFLQEFVPPVFQVELDRLYRARKQREDESVAQYTVVHKILLDLLEDKPSPANQCRNYKFGLKKEIRDKLPVLGTNFTNLERLVS